MAERRIPKRIAAALGVRAGEGAAVLLFFLYFFFITAPFTIVKSVRDASYLDDIGVRHLPWAYATAALVAGAVAVHARLQARLKRRNLLVGSLAFFGATALVFRVLLAGNQPGVTLVYWLWANIFVVVLTTQFWFLVNDLFDPRAAKRLVGFLGSGGILGGIAGGLLTGFLAEPGQPENLLYVAAALLAVGAAVVTALFRRLEKSSPAGPLGSVEGPSAPGAGFLDSWRTVRSDRYLRGLAALAILTGVVSTFIDWQSKAVIDSVPAAKANLASFFGQFNAGLLAVTFVFQLVLTSRFLGRFGLRPSLMIYPLALLACAGGVAVWPLLGWALAIKGADKAFSYSIQQSSRELLYIPVPADRKYRAKIFIDMFLNRFSKTIGAGLLLFLFLFPGARDIRVVSAASAVLILAWLAVNVSVGRAYGRAVKDRLEEKWESGEGLVTELAEAETAKELLDALDSRRRSPSLYALHLYEMARDGRLTPDILRFLDEENAAMAPAPSHPLIDEAGPVWIPGPESELISAGAEIREILALPDYQNVMNEYAARILRGGRENETAKMELAKAAGLMDPHSPLAGRVEDLLQDESPEVVHFAAGAAGRLRRREFLPMLVARLSDPQTRSDAAGALVEYGAAVAGTLGDALVDGGLSAEVRRRIAAILSETPDQDVVDVLLEALAAGGEDTDREVIDALDRLRSADPGLGFEAAAVEAAIGRELARLTAARKRADGLWLFKLLGLLDRREDFTRAGQNFAGGTKGEAAYALELVDHVLSLAWKEKVLPVLEGLARLEEEA
jgi:ATP:ADP antiporter, AAA family